MPNKRDKCLCPGREAGAESAARGAMEIPRAALELLRDVRLSSEFKEVVREVVVPTSMASPAEMEGTPVSPETVRTSIIAPARRVSVSPVELSVPSVSVPRAEVPALSGGKGFYLTDLTLDLSGVAHLTPGLLALSFSSLSHIVINDFACCPEGDEEVLSMKFSTDRVVTGFTLPEDKSTIESKEETLTIRPEKLADKVKLEIAGEKRATLRIIGVDPDAGTITFRVKGKSSTPADKRDGDTIVQAVLGAAKEETNVVVVIPEAIATPHPTFDGEVNGVNMVISATSKPAATPATLKALKQAYPDRDVIISTAYLRILTITVNDQFGDKLDAIYAGTPVTEEGDPINQQMTATGAYSDPVGPLVNFAYHSQSGADAYAATEPLEPAPVEDKTVNKGVEVGGHSLNPAIVNRRVTMSPKPGAPTTGKLKITWPD